jgi:hypothetical protein
MLHTSRWKSVKDSGAEPVLANAVLVALERQPLRISLENCEINDAASALHLVQHSQLN